MVSRHTRIGERRGIISNGVNFERWTEKWKLHAKGMELPGRVLLFYIVPLIPNLIAGYSPASQKGVGSWGYSVVVFMIF
jgi:hypothetical protein